MTILPGPLPVGWHRAEDLGDSVGGYLYAPVVGRVTAAGAMFNGATKLSGQPPKKDGKPDILRAMWFVELAVRLADAKARAKKGASV